MNNFYDSELYNLITYNSLGLVAEMENDLVRLRNELSEKILMKVEHFDGQFRSKEEVSWSISYLYE